MGKLNLRRHYPTDITCNISEDTPGVNLLVSAQVSMTAGHNTENKLDWRISTTVKFSAKVGEIAVANGSVTFVGFFDAPSDMAEDKRPGFVVSNGVPILYSATRELLANLTARAPGKLVTLPPFDFGNVSNPLKGEPKQVTSVMV